MGLDVGGACCRFLLAWLLLLLTVAGAVAEPRIGDGGCIGAARPEETSSLECDDDDDNDADRRRDGFFASVPGGDDDAADGCTSRWRDVDERDLDPANGLGDTAAPAHAMPRPATTVLSPSPRSSDLSHDARRALPRRTAADAGPGSTNAFSRARRALSSSSSHSSSWIVADDVAVGACPESRFQSPKGRADDGEGVRRAGCCSVGGAMPGR